MHPDLVKLLELQAKDVDLLDADRGLGIVLADADTLDQQLAGAVKAVEEAHKAVAEAVRRRKELMPRSTTTRSLRNAARHGWIRCGRQRNWRP